MNKKGDLRDGGWMEGLLVKDYGEFLGEVTTLWAISGMSGTGVSISQDIKCGQTCRRGGNVLAARGCIDANQQKLGMMCRR